MTHVCGGFFCFHYLFVLLFYKQDMEFFFLCNVVCVYYTSLPFIQLTGTFVIVHIQRHQVEVAVMTVIRIAVIVIVTQVLRIQTTTLKKNQANPPSKVPLHP